MSADAKHPAEVLADECEDESRSNPDDYRWKAAEMLRRITALEAERDQLRAEVEALRDDCENARELARPVCEALNIPILHDAPRAIEALRADAERYRWLRDNPWPPGLESIVALHRNVLWDASIDAARKQQ